MWIDDACCGLVDPCVVGRAAPAQHDASRTAGPSRTIQFVRAGGEDDLGGKGRSNRDP